MSVDILTGYSFRLEVKWMYVSYTVRFDEGILSRKADLVMMVWYGMVWGWLDGCAWWMAVVLLGIVWPGSACGSVWYIGQPTGMRLVYTLYSILYYTYYNHHPLPPPQCCHSVFLCLPTYDYDYDYEYIQYIPITNDSIFRIRFLKFNTTAGLLIIAYYDS